METPLDILIVGQGVAGSVLAWEVLARGGRVAIVDNNHKNSSTKVAAGLLNPVTGKRLVKHKHMEAMLPAAVAFYRELEVFFGEPLLEATEILRIFHADKEKSIFNKRILSVEYKTYLEGPYEAGKFGENLHDELGSFKIKPAYVLDTKRFLALMQKHFEGKGIIQCEEFDYKQLRTAPAGVLYKNQAAKMIVFCEGYRAVRNPFFSWLPFSPAKGEVLTVKANTMLPKEVLICKQWMIPGNEGIKVGSTYNWDILDEEATPKARKSLIKAFYSIAKTSEVPQVIDHEAGVRPATQDAFPIIGMHPQEPRVGIFNGFGARGTLWVPFYARQFVDFLEEKAQLHPEVDIARALL